MPSWGGPCIRGMRAEPCSVMNGMKPAPEGMGADAVGTALRDGHVKPPEGKPVRLRRGPPRVALPQWESAQAPGT